MGDGKPPAVDAEQDGSAIARIILTSGTTGDQKAVPLSHDIILRRIQTYDFAFGNRIANLLANFPRRGDRGQQRLSLGHLCARARRHCLCAWQRSCRNHASAVAIQRAMHGGFARGHGGISRLLRTVAGLPLSLRGRCCRWAASWRRRCPTGCERACVRTSCSGYGATEGNPVAGGLRPSNQAHQGRRRLHNAGNDRAGGRRRGSRSQAGETKAISAFAATSASTAIVGNPPGSEKFFRDGWFYPGDIGAVTEDRRADHLRPQQDHHRSRRRQDQSGGDRGGLDVVSRRGSRRRLRARQCARHRGSLGRRSRQVRSSIRRPFAPIARRGSAARWFPRGYSGCRKCRAMSATRSTATR